jgi:PhzF family phenazine biosynthesis protein
MKSIPFYQVDAFTQTCFAGNPAAVLLPDESLPVELMQKIAAENNLSESVFIIKNSTGYDIRWFTPEQEVALCGHGTLAAAFVIKKYLDPDLQQVTFASLSGPLKVSCPHADGLITLDFPAKPLFCKPPFEFCLQDAIGDLACQKVLFGTDTVFIVMANEADVHSFAPRQNYLKQLPIDLIVTSRAQKYDFISRLFSPGTGIAEDPVTGSAHCYLAPYWGEQLGKTTLHAKQVSGRGGELHCRIRADQRVEIGGFAVAVIEGKFLLP